MAGKWNLDYAAGRMMSLVGVGGSLCTHFGFQDVKKERIRKDLLLPN